MFHRQQMLKLLQSLKLIDFIIGAIRSNVLFSILYKYGAQRLIDYKFPRKMHVDPSRICNIECIMCAPRTSKKPLGLMEFEVFKLLIDESSHYGSRSFSLCKDGEPFINPDIIKMLEYVKRTNPRNEIILTTNGLLLNEQRSLSLLQLEVDKITVSVRAASEKAYYDICKNGNYDKVENNIKNLLRLKSDGGYKKPVVFLQYISLSRYVSEERLFIDKWNRYDVELSIVKPFSWSGVIKDPMIGTELPAKRYPCYELWFTPAINWNGDVSICCFDWDMENIIGNLKQKSLAEIWQGDALKYYRELHLKGEYNKIPLCDKCLMWSHYPDLFFWYQKK